MSNSSNIRAAIIIIKSLSQFIDIQVIQNTFSEFIDLLLSEDPFILNLNNLYSRIYQCGDLFNKSVSDCLEILVSYLGCANNYQTNFVVMDYQWPFYFNKSELYVKIASFTNQSGLLYCYWDGKWMNLGISSPQNTIKEKPYNVYWKFRDPYYALDDFILNTNPSQLLSDWVSKNPKRTLGNTNTMPALTSSEYLARFEKEIAELRNQVQIKDQKIHELETENKNAIEDMLQQLQSKNQVNPYASQSISSIVINNPVELVAALKSPSKHPLPNYGNTCYLNAIVQVLASMNIFIIELIKAKGPTLKLLRNLLIDMRLPNKRNEAGLGIKQLKYDLSIEFPSLNTNDQQDSTEVLGMIFNKFEEEFPNSILFVTNSVQTFKCKYHDYSSIIKDSDTFLVIPPLFYSNVEEYLQSWKNPTIFSDNDLLKCDLCGSNSISMMRRVLINKPIYLILSFQRIDVAVRLPESLDFEENRYLLFAVVSYTVSGSSGHYTAYTKENYSWTHYNDEHIENIDFLNGIPGVYLAFYALNSLASY
ncbi:unnamed protein product [Blepharisma stoltei]|uniref:USP domain-containing protein n=1 Tax=Blepharisma stoltei TaxID=1481888 RepID=A0AAU9J0P8_9CILI|nr:unnamed protein product [Blepharisma stoltei]